MFGDKESWKLAFDLSYLPSDEIIKQATDEFNISILFDKNLIENLKSMRALYLDLLAFD